MSRVGSAPPARLVPELAALLAGEPTVVVPGGEALPAEPPEEFTGVVVATSGSTGHPRWVMLPRDGLLAAAAATHARLGGAGAWANPLPVHYVAGLMTAVRAVVAGCPYIPVAPDLSDLPAATERTYLSVVPAQLYAGLADAALTRRLATYHTILLGGAAADATLLERAGTAGLRIVTTYGLSETSGGVVYDGVPLDGVEIDLAPLPDTDEGRIRLATPTRFAGYLGDPEATAAASDGRWVWTNDRGRLVDGRLIVTGRVDEVVQSGGCNVDLAEIQRRLDAAWPGEVASFAVPDPRWGATVVVASTGPALGDIVNQLAPLGSPARPRGFLPLERLPRTASGKIDRRTLVAMWRSGGERT